VLATGVIAVTVARSPGAAGDLRAAVEHLSGLRLAWLGAAVTAQMASLAGGVAAQFQLLAVGGARLRRRIVFGLVPASTGLARLMPAGPLTGGAWQVREYHRRGVSAGAGVWAVFSGGLTSTAAALALLLAGAAVAGIDSLPLLGCAVAVMAAAMAGLTTARRSVGALSRWLRRHHRRWLAIDRLASAVSGLSRQHAGYGWAAAVLACTGAALLADAGVFAACFGLAGLPVPWRALLFAYAAGQLAGRLVPLPGGLGGMEGGAFGALTLAGIPPSAAAALVIYRIAGYWVLGTAGAASAVVLAGRARRPAGVARRLPAGNNNRDARESRMPISRRRGLTGASGGERLPPGEEFDRAVEPVIARAADLGALQRPVGRCHRVPVFHFGGQPAP
jgi:uncharacterized membrane protein YbhN (UPF0104 family)